MFNIQNKIWHNYENFPIWEKRQLLSSSLRNPNDIICFFHEKLMPIPVKVQKNRSKNLHSRSQVNEDSDNNM